MKDSTPINWLFLYQETSFWGTAYCKGVRTWVCRCVANIVWWEWCLFVLLIVLQAMWSSKYKSSNSGHGILRLISCSSVVLIEFIGKFIFIHRHWSLSDVQLNYSYALVRSSTPEFHLSLSDSFDVSNFIHCVLYVCVRRC